MNHAMNSEVINLGFPLEMFRTAFASGAYLRHVIVDGLFDHKWLTQLKNPDGDFMNECQSDVRFAEINNKIFLANIPEVAERVTGIAGLSLVSQRLCILTEGKSDPLNNEPPGLAVFIYLNPFWMIEMGGGLEIATQYQPKPIAINPIWNRTVIIQVGKNHLTGHPSVVAKGHTRFIKIKLETEFIK